MKIFSFHLSPYDRLFCLPLKQYVLSCLWVLMNCSTSFLLDPYCSANTSIVICIIFYIEPRCAIQEHECSSPKSCEQRKKGIVHVLDVSVVTDYCLSCLDHHLQNVIESLLAQNIFQPLSQSDEKYEENISALFMFISNLCVEYAIRCDSTKLYFHVEFWLFW